MPPSNSIPLRMSAAQRTSLIVGTALASSLASGGLNAEAAPMDDVLPPSPEPPTASATDDQPGPAATPSAAVSPPAAAPSPEPAFSPPAALTPAPTAPALSAPRPSVGVAGPDVAMPSPQLSAPVTAQQSTPTGEGDQASAAAISASQLLATPAAPAPRPLPVQPEVPPVTPQFSADLAPRSQPLAATTIEASDEAALDSTVPTRSEAPPITVDSTAPAAVSAPSTASNSAVRDSAALDPAALPPTEPASTARTLADLAPTNPDPNAPTLADLISGISESPAPSASAPTAPESTDLAATDPESTALEPTDSDSALLDPDAPDQLAQDIPPPPVDSSALTAVGLGVNGRVTITSTLVRGQEDGTAAVDFANWLLPINEVARALDIMVTPLDNGQWELRATGLLVQIDPNELQRDPALGLVLSIAEIESRLGVPATFDLLDYAVDFAPPWAGLRATGARREEAPIVTDGLPVATPEPFTLTFAAQDLNISGGENRDTTTQGDFTLLGTLGDGSWYLRMRQDEFGDPSSWNFNEAQYLIETPGADYAVGSQPTFWSSQSSDRYWGVTTIQRQNYEPQLRVGAGGFSPSARQQADTVGRDIVGEADPGSVVQLIQGSRANVVAETVVDSSGVYRFEDVPQGGLYEVLVFPNGQLTAQPETQNVSFSTLPTQLPEGASAFVASAGLRQSTLEDDLIGDFGDLGGGLAYRQGLTGEVTVGAGLVYDEGTLGLAELFYQPTDMPIQLALSTLAGGADGPEFNADFVYDPPESGFRLDLNTDELSSRFRANWQVNPRLGLRATGDTRDDAVGLGLTTSFNTTEANGFASVDVLSNGDLRWNGLARYGALELSSLGNEVSTSSDLLVKLDPGRSFTEGHFLRLGYDTQITEQTDDLVSLGYRYQSPSRAQDGRFHWAVDAAYGVGSQGSGPILAVSTAVVPGLVVQARYEGVSTISGESSFAIELLPFYNLQAGVATDDSRFAYFRQQGGVWVQPFADRNGNGTYDADETLLLDYADLLIRLNNQPVDRFQPTVYDDGVLLSTMPGLYRLDLDPAGYPLNWTPNRTSYAVEVVSGSFTPVYVPFTASYTVAGRVSDRNGDPISQAIVEAVPSDGGLPVTTVTTTGGVYFLEELSLGAYTLRVNQQSVSPGEIVLSEESEPLQEINLRWDASGPSPEPLSPNPE